MSVNRSLTTLEKEILHYPKIQELLEKDPTVKKQILANIKEIKGNFNPRLIKSLIKLIDFTLAKLYDDFSLTVVKGFSLEQALKQYHIVLVPNHQSHADYIALSYMMYKRFEVPIYIAGGINLDIFPIGPIFRKAGAFFLRRTFGNDLVYKYSFEAYIYFLLGQKGMIEFFFEGGRSRTGKLMSPRFGLFSMILEAHKERASQGLTDKPLMFVPVTIAHEIVPENKAHAKELGGKKKVKEKTSQLLKVFTLANKKLGSIHVQLQQGIVVNSYEDIKQKTHDVAFECFRKIGQGMPVTPSSLLALVMLDEPSGALNWITIKERAFEVLDYCLFFHIPVVSSLKKGEAPLTLKKALKIFINNKKVEEIHSKTLVEKYYSIKVGRRVEMLYFKNMILHHFIVPHFINSALYNLFNGSIKNHSDLTSFLINKRRELKFEFYLPSFKETLSEGLKIISYAIGRTVKDLEEAFSFSSQELFQIAQKVRGFGGAFSYLFECYYLAVLGLKEFQKDQSFTVDQFLKKLKEIHSFELQHGKVIKYPESYLAPILNNSLEFFIHQKAVNKLDKKNYQVIDEEKLKALELSLEKTLQDQLSLSVKLYGSSYAQESRERLV